MARDGCGLVADPRCGAQRNRRRRFAKFFRAGCAFAAACRLHGYLHAFLGWHTSIGRIFWEVLFVQRCARCWWKSWAALARRAGAPWQPCLALLLPDRAESDLRG